MLFHPAAIATAAAASIHESNSIGIIQVHTQGSSIPAGAGKYEEEQASIAKGKERVKSSNNKYPDDYNPWDHIPEFGKVRVVPRGTPADPRYWTEGPENFPTFENFDWENLLPEEDFYYSDGDSDNSEEHG